MQLSISGGNSGAKLCVLPLSEENGITYWRVEMQLPQAEVPACFSVKWQEPCMDCYSVWKPTFAAPKFLAPNWRKNKIESRLAYCMPLEGVFSARDRNRVTVAVSDGVTPITIGVGVSEETACLEWKVEFFTVPTALRTAYSAVIRIDRRDVAFYESLQDAAQWWETDCGYPPAEVPEHARLPMNSLWYSYHQQLDPADILKECRLSKAMGMDTVIIDDGWQTDDNNRGYAYCGDWELATGKIPDMAAFIRELHTIGMKAMLWYSVPFMGIRSKNFARFQDMLLDQTGNRKDYFALDPRYQEVRDFLIGIYADAVQKWDLDGLKLDFIDSFRLAGKSLEEDPRRDYASLEDAIDRLMTDILTTLRGIKKDIMIEFRQTYVGPAIRKYGNMLRVRDCPNDPIINREEVIRLRMTSGTTPVHSDMLMWHPEERVECAALQMVSVLYGVPQISMKIAHLREDHRKMLAFYLRFWRQNRGILLDGALRVSAPECLCAQVTAAKEGEAITTAYTDPLILAEGYKRLVAVNGTKQDFLLLKGAKGCAYRVVDCMGELLRAGTVSEELMTVEVPLAGMVEVLKNE